MEATRWRRPDGGDQMEALTWGRPHGVALTKYIEVVMNYI